jgi:transposase InsO family protein
MQVELLNTRRWKTRVELANAISSTSRSSRRHSSLGMLTPIEFELLNTTTKPAG